MDILIVGAGFSGIITAKTLRELGHRVTILEKCSDIGGVWSSSRRYPGLTTQNTKDTYFYSDMPLPKDYPEWPTGRQILSYLEAYVAKHHLHESIHLNSEVTTLERPPDGKRWTIKTNSQKSYTADHIVICTGVFSQPHLPSLKGQAAYEAGGGRVLHTSQIGDVEAVRGKSVVIVGYGKSACDIADSISTDGGAKQTTIVARHLLWKLPRHILGLCYKWLLLTRFGESLFKYIQPSSFIERWFHHTSLGRATRGLLMDTLGILVTKILHLDSLGLVPQEPFENIARSNIGLSTDGLYPKVQDGRVSIIHGTEISELVVRAHTSEEARLGATLRNGAFVAADVIICGTGFCQDPPPFLPEDVRSSLVDDIGDWVLYQHIKPPRVDGITFNGFSSSFFCPTTAEVAALWIGAYLARGKHALPPPDVQERLAKEKLAWLRQMTHTKHSKGTSVVPFSLHTIDAILKEIGIDISARDRLKQWVSPVNPAAYRHLHEELAVVLARE